MSTDLTGHDAFDKVLDALTEAVRKGADEHRLLDVRDHQFREASGAASNALAEVRVLKKKIDDHEKLVIPKLHELHVAASDLLLKLTQTLGDAGMVAPQLDAQRKRLNAALKATEGPCDIMPF